jgi:hypothetical protein
MARKTQRVPDKSQHSAAARGPRGRQQHAAARAKRQPPRGVGPTPHPPEAAAAPSAATAGPPPGLDAARHAAAQRAARGAEVLRKGAFAALMASALSLDQLLETSAYRAYLEEVLAQAGNPTDPIERMLVEQTCLAHFRVAQLHVGASQAKGAEVVKMYNAVAARLLGEMRRTALALRAYRTRFPEHKPEKNLKLFKAAQ